ncbi:hypothetical protein, partial [Mesorhizobium caraganae]|uniref:hypothetical protein n=1 Tax=Mesorhizobium caraganae TaxID=483206 RepID=UPI0033394DD9
ASSSPGTRAELLIFPSTDFPYNPAECLQKPTYLCTEIAAHVDHLGTGGKQGPHAMAVEALDRHFFIPAAPNNLS